MGLYLRISKTFAEQMNGKVSTITDATIFAYAVTTDGKYVCAPTSATGTSLKYYMGCHNGSNISGLGYQNTSTIGFAINRGATDLVLESITPNQLLQAIRTSSSSTTPRRNTTAYSSNSASSVTPPTLTMPLGCRRLNSTTYTDYANCTLSFYMFTHGMTTTNADLLANRIITLLTNTAGT